jgi:hypothetical protein
MTRSTWIWTGLATALTGGLLLTQLPAHDHTGMFASQRLHSEAITESSGLVASRTYEGVFWTHNDSGDTPRIFAINRLGELLVEVTVLGAHHQDWEDIAIDDTGHLFLGDIGNNRNKRLDLTVYRVPEPDPRSDTRSVQVDRTLPFRYANQVIGSSLPNFDAEALIWHAGAIYLFTKHRADTQSQLYRLEDRAGLNEQILQPLGTLELSAPDRDPDLAQVTAADISADGRRIALLTYGAIHLFELEGVTPWPLTQIRRIPLDPKEAQQAESIAWDGTALWFGNEQQWLFRLPEPGR